MGRTRPHRCFASPLHGGVDRNVTWGPVDNEGQVAPSRGRGSKLWTVGRSRRLQRVAPSRGRGSKLMTWDPQKWKAPRRPFTGAWIETPPIAPKQPSDRVAPSRGRGSKHAQKSRSNSVRQVAPSRGRGSKPPTRARDHGVCVSPLHGGVDRNTPLSDRAMGRSSLQCLRQSSSFSAASAKLVNQCAFRPTSSTEFSRTGPVIIAEFQIRAAILNRFTALGTPLTHRAG